MAGDAGGERVQHDERGEHGAAVVGVEGAHQRQAKHAEGERQQLQPGAHEGAEQRAAGREAEDVAVHKLPPALLRVLGVLVVDCVLDEVVLEHAHEDGGQESGEQQHGDAGVDDGEPVDLEVLLQELVLAVLVHPPLKRHRRLLPRHAVRELGGDLGGAALGDVHRLRGVGLHVDLNHAVAVVGQLEVDVREEEELLGLAVARGHRLHLAHVPPDGEVVVDELVVVVLGDGLAEGGQLLALERLFAQHGAVFGHLEAQVVGRGHHAVAVDHLHARTAGGVRSPRRRRGGRSSGSGTGGHGCTSERGRLASPSVSSLLSISLGWQNGKS